MFDSLRSRLALSNLLITLLGLAVMVFVLVDQKYMTVQPKEILIVDEF